MERKDIPGFGGYSVTRNGDVFSPKGEKIPKCKVDNFLAVEIGDDSYYIQDLVYWTFRGGLTDDSMIVHADGDPNNNDLQNLILIPKDKKVLFDAVQEHNECRNRDVEKNVIGGLPKHEEQPEYKAVRGTFKDRSDAILKQRLKEREKFHDLGVNAFSGEKPIIGLDSIDKSFVSLE